MVVFDTATLLLFLDAAAKQPLNPKSGKPLERAKDRIDYLVSRLEEQNEKILLPTPVLGEAFVHARDAANQYHAAINESSRFKIADFDYRSALELAAMTQEAIASGDKRAGSTAPWQKVKFDRQIIAIGRVHGAIRIYSDNDDIERIALPLGMEVIQTWKLPLPPEDSQQILELPEPED